MKKFLEKKGIINIKYPINFRRKFKKKRIIKLCDFLTKDELLAYLDADAQSRERLRKKD